MRKRKQVHSYEEGSTRLWGYNVDSYPRHDFFYCNYSSHDFHPPLYVIFAGYDHWIQGCYRQRVDSGIFGLSLITQGDMWFTQDGTTTHLGEGDLMLLHKNSTHEVTTGPAGQCRFCVTLIDGSILGTLLRTLGLVSTNTIRVRNADAIKEKIDAMVSTIRTVPSQYALRLSTLSYELLLDISRNILTPAHPPVLMAAIEYMQKRITNALSLPELCRDLGISVSTCNRLFRTHLSVSPKAFYLQQKAEFAAQLLRTSHLSIKEIAVYTGYEDNHYFSNEFKKRMGCSPRAYRKKTAP